MYRHKSSQQQASKVTVSLMRFFVRGKLQYCADNFGKKESRIIERNSFSQHRSTGWWRRDVHLRADVEKVLQSGRRRIIVSNMSDGYALPLVISYLTCGSALLAWRFAFIKNRKWVGIGLISCLLICSIACLAITEYVGGEVGTTAIGCNLVLSFCTCVLYHFLEEFQARRIKSMSALFDSARRRPCRSFFEVFLLILTIGLLYTMLSQTRLMQLMDNGDLCFTVEDQDDENKNFDGNVGKLSPITELCLYVIASFGLGFYASYFAFYRRVESFLQIADSHAAHQKDILKRKISEIQAMSNAWIIEYNEIKFRHKIGSGSSATVWRGKLRDRYDVAVKQIYNVSNESKLLADDEVRFLQRARHPRLVLFMGCGTLPDKEGIFLVLEYCDGGNLSDLLYREGAGVSKLPADTPQKILRRKDRSSSVVKRMKRKSRIPSWRTRLRLLEDIAEGIAYLHLCHFCIHRDLKPANCLLSESPRGGLRAKVADFGLCRLEKESRVSDSASKSLSSTLTSLPTETSGPDTKETNAPTSSNTTMMTGGIG